MVVLLALMAAMAAVGVVLEVQEFPDKVIKPRHLIMEPLQEAAAELAELVNMQELQPHIHIVVLIKEGQAARDYMYLMAMSMLVVAELVVLMLWPLYHI
jgi:hypothetical protein